VNEEVIRAHWQKNPVGESFVGRLTEKFGDDHESFFEAYDAWYYGRQPHVLRSLDRFAWEGRQVLEIGLGQGSDSEQLIRRGALWSGIDLTAESVKRVSRRLASRGLCYRAVAQASALAIPFGSGAFDTVFSHGVLHHIPDILAAQREIRRVLKPDGRLIIMVYAKNSLNYQLSIRLIRRMGLVVLYAYPNKLGGIYGAHVQNAKRAGLLNYLGMSNLVHRSTDGPDNPYSKVYDRRLLQTDFPDFELLQTFKCYMHAPPLPVHRLPGESHLGWHLWAEFRPRARAAINKHAVSQRGDRAG
jgi:SAM-dependent methyltransferase